MKEKKTIAVKEGAEKDASFSAEVEALRLFRILIRSAQRHSAWVERQCGVTGAQLWIIQELSESPGMRVGEIAERLAIHQTTASNLLDSLVKKGLAEKVRDDADQRVVKVVLSKQGRALVRRAPKPARGLLPEALRCMSAKDLKALSVGLRALVAVIEVPEDGAADLPFPFNM